MDLDGALDVAAVVGGGVLVDLDQDDAVVVEMALDPVGVDKYRVTTHAMFLQM